MDGGCVSYQLEALVWLPSSILRLSLTRHSCWREKPRYDKIFPCLTGASLVENAVASIVTSIHSILSKDGPKCYWPHRMQQLAERPTPGHWTLLRFPCLLIIPPGKAVGSGGMLYWAAPRCDRVGRQSTPRRDLRWALREPALPCSRPTVLFRVHPQSTDLRCP